MSEEKNFSYTIEIKDGEFNGLLTVRGTTKEEFIENLNAIDDLIQKRQIKPKINGTTKETTDKLNLNLTKDLGKCKKCGSPNKLSKQGKVYCGALCWKKSKSY